MRIYPKRPISRLRGLGDLVEVVAKPVARAIDRAAGTNIRNCEGCAKRKEALNKFMPLNSPPTEL